MKRATSGAAWRRAIVTAASVAGALAMPARAVAQCAAKPGDGGFEIQHRARVDPPWVQEGSAAIDILMENSHDGDNNASAGGRTGWNAIRQRVQLVAGAAYTLTAFVRTTGDVRDGYFGFRDAAQHPVVETKFGPYGRYTQLSVRFRPGVTGTYNVFIGFWAPTAQSRIQVDDVQLIGGPCGDVILVPDNG